MGGEEWLYRSALALKHGGSLSYAARLFVRNIVGEGSRTPDGALYTFKAVRSAMNGLE